MTLRSALSVFLFVAVAFVIYTSPASAATLTKIGNSTVTSQAIKTWSYTSANPLLSGTASPSAQVTITIDSVSSSVTADTAGAWSYKPTTLTEGNHQVVITEGTSSLTFTLSIDAAATASGSATTTTKGGVTATGSGSVTYPSTLPQTGSDSLPFLLVGAACMLVGTGMYIQRWATRTV